MHKELTKARLTLVGAGPGDPELITIKALKAIQAADVILYDSLVSTEIFDLAFPNGSDSIELIFVGKRRAIKSISQEEINELIAKQLRANKNVVRLKGGDPFIFARGVEEAQVANDLGYPIEIIPGLSSGLAVPVSNGVALTLRQKSDAVTLTTAHDFSETKCKLWLDLLQAGSTLVIYMGLFNIVEILAALKLELGEDFPVVAIQDGTLSHERILKSNIKDMPQDLIDASFKSPVIFVLGKHINQELVVDKSRLSCNILNLETAVSQKN